jgi:hypothetical protein
MILLGVNQPFIRMISDPRTSIFDVQGLQNLVDEIHTKNMRSIILLKGFGHTSVFVPGYTKYKITTVTSRMGTSTTKEVVEQRNSYYNTVRRAVACIRWDFASCVHESPALDSLPTPSHGQSVLVKLVPLCSPTNHCQDIINEHARQLVDSLRHNWDNPESGAWYFTPPKIMTVP